MKTPYYLSDFRKQKRLFFLFHLFQGPLTSGVVVLTNSGRFFVASNIDEPRVRKLPDVEWNPKTGGDNPKS